MGTVERFIHDMTIIELTKFYIVLKKDYLVEYRRDKIRMSMITKNFMDQETYLLSIPTLSFIRSLIVLKLTNELREMYLEIYGDEENNYHSTALDFTTYDEYALVKQLSSEIDLEDFFLTNEYIFNEKLTFTEEIEAEIENDEERNKYIQEVHYELIMEHLNTLKQNKNKKNG